MAKSTVERLMRRHGWQGVRRQKSVRTTIADPAAERAPDLVDRQFRVPTPNALVVADFTYVKLVTGVFVYVAFVIDAYAGAIIGWEAASVKQTRFVESAIRQAAALRARQGHPIDGAIHHSDAGSQYTAIHFGETLSLSGLRPSIGSVGDAYDNALAETTIGLYKNECIRADSPFRRGPLRNLADVELITADYVAWYNQQRLMHRLGRIPPAEAEAEYYDQLTPANRPAHRTPRVHETRDGSTTSTRAHPFTLTRMCCYNSVTANHGTHGRPVFVLHMAAVIGVARQRPGEGDDVFPHQASR